MMLTARSGNASVSRLDPAANWLLGQVPESVLDRDQYVRNQVHFIHAFDDAYKFDEVAFDVSQVPFVGLYVHVIFLSGARSLDQGARNCFAERECRRLQDRWGDTECAREKIE
jgi:hypothetical protein